MIKRFQIDDDGDIIEFQNQQWVDCWEYANGKDWDNLCNKLNELYNEKEKLKQQLSDINGQLVMLDNCDNWDYDRMKHTVREIAEIIGYNGTINPKR